MQTDQYITQRRQLYMLPTKAGYIYSLVVFLLFLAAIKFSHQATFLLTFLLSGFALVSALHTQKNINHIHLQVKKSKAVFLGDQAQFICNISHRTEIDRKNLWLICADHQFNFDLNKNESLQHLIKLTPSERGRYSISPVTLTSHYPLGILFGWSKAFQSNATCIVYPKPKDLLALPSLEQAESDESSKTIISHSNIIHRQGDIASLKPYQVGDRLRDIHWPAFAKSKQLVSKEYEQNTEPKRIFSWQQVSSLPTEDKLSQLTYWLVNAEKNQLDYQLIIPGYKSELANGSEHLHQCLSKLALWEKE